MITLLQTEEIKKAHNYSRKKNTYEMEFESKNNASFKNIIKNPL